MSFLDRARAKLTEDERRERESEVARVAAELESQERMRATLAESRERGGLRARRELAEARKRLADHLGKVAERVHPFKDYAALPVEGTWVLFTDLDRLERGRRAAMHAGLDVGSRREVRQVTGRNLHRYVRSVAYVDPSAAELAELAQR